MDDDEGLLAAEFERAPTARVCAALANAAVRRNQYVRARTLYERAIALDPAFAAAHLAAAELAYIGRDEIGARVHLGRALSLQRYFPDPFATRRERRMVMLLRDATSTENAPLELLLDRSSVAIDKCFVKGYDGALPSGAKAVTAFGWWSDARETIDAAKRYQPINDPANLLRASRPHLARSLDGIRLVRSVAAVRVSAGALDSIESPAVVRPADTHAGRGLALIGSSQELRDHAARFPSSAYDVAPFVEYRSNDGYYRKYRVVMVGGRAYPYHLAISPRWIVHYQSSPMHEHVWMREEEEAFLQEPQRIFPQWGASMEAIAKALGLDYVGLDLTRLADGTMLVFEADPAMLVHDEDAESIFAYKRPFVARIRDALTARVFAL